SFDARGPGLLRRPTGLLAMTVERMIMTSAMPLMTGFPPPAEGQVTLANWRTSPFNRWGFQHVREIVPSADIPHAPGHVWGLPSAPADLSTFSFEHDGARLDFDSFLAATDTDGIVILHRGAVIA